jgi:hypothetical protein
MSGLLQQNNGEAMTQGLTLSRRVMCAGGVFAAGAAAMPFGVMAQPEFIGPSAPLHLRGVSVGQSAVLRTAGTVAVETAGSEVRAWRFAETTDVSWSVDGATVIEHRSGQIRVNGKTFSTGPVSEILCADECAATIATTRGVASLVVTTATLGSSDVWDILDDPTAAPLAHGVSEYRVFKTTHDNSVRDVYWALRSPWLAALGAASPDTRLIWRGQGQLVTLNAVG